MDRIPLYLVALIVAIMKTPTNVFQICARNHGTVEIEPWHTKLTAPVARGLEALVAPMRAFFRASGGLPAVAALGVLLLVVGIVAAHDSHAGVLTANVIPFGLKALRQRDSELKAAVLQAKKARLAIGEKAVAEKRGMTDEELAQFEAGKATIAGLEAQLAQNADLLQAAEEANEAERTYTGAAVVDADATASDAAKKTIIVGKDRSLEAPGYFGKQLHAVRAAALAQKGGDSLTSEQLALLKPMTAGPTGANTDVPSEGGFMVASQRSSTIIQRAYETGQILSRVMRLPIGAGFNGTKIPAIDETSRADNSRFGGIVSGWLGQGNGLMSGKPKFREIDLKLRKVGAFVYGTDEMLVDSVMFEGWVNQNLPKELAFRTEDAVVNGTGANQPLGMLNTPAVITRTRASAGHIISEDLRGMWKRMWAGARANSVWLYDQSIEDELDALAIPIGTGGQLDPSYKPAGSMPGQVFATYKNRPMIPVEYMAALGTSGDIVLANFDEYVLIDKGGVDAQVSLHVAFLTDEAVFRFIYRVDGQCTWNAPLTPKSGGDTLSCVVKLS